MTPEEQAYFDEARSLFMMSGWEEYMKELVLHMDSTTLDGCSSAEEFWRAKGKLEGLRIAYSYEDQVKAAEEEYDA